MGMILQVLFIALIFCSTEKLDHFEYLFAVSFYLKILKRFILCLVGMLLFSELAIINTSSFQQLFFQALYYHDVKNLSYVNTAEIIDDLI